MLRKCPFVLLVFVLALSACSGAPQDAAALQASGVIEAGEILIAPEVPGTVAEVFVNEGDSVRAGDPLFRLQNDLLEAQYRQAQAAVEAAQAAVQAARAGRDTAQAVVETARAGLEAAQAQYRLALLAARAAEQPRRLADWQQAPPANFTLPNWYFDSQEKISAAESELRAAENALQAEQDNYQSVLDGIGAQDVLDAETRLNNARAAFQVADVLYQRAIDAQNGQASLSAYVQSLYDAAKSELDAAQRNYEQALTAKERADLLEARARLSAARERYQTALDAYNALQTGERAPEVLAAQAVVAQAQAQVKQAEAGVTQAEAAIGQAEKALAQAQAALDSVQVQRDKLTVRAPVDGVVSTRSVDAGELVQPGMGALTLAQLDSLTVTVYIPENRYGEVSLGQSARLSVDSFPGETFAAVVVTISERAEYTPRNVQTKEERVNTVYAVKLRVEDGGSRLKPGMPADVTFGGP